MADIRIRIGASVDADFGALIFKPIAQGARQAKAAVRDQMREAAAEAKRVAKLNDAENRRVAREGAAFQRELDRASAANFRRTVQEREAEARKAARATAAEQKKAAQEAATQQRALDRENAAAVRRQMQEQEQAAKVAERRQSASVQHASGLVGGSMRAFGGMVRHGIGIASDLARGGGIDLDLGSALKERMALQSAATDISNSGLMEKTGAAGERNTDRVDPKKIMEAAQSVGIATAMDPQELLKGLGEFVSKTGDLETGLSTLKNMAEFAKATGSEFEHVAGATAAVANKLDDVTDAGQKADIAQKVMMALGGEGKVGAVEVKNMAGQLEKLTSVSTKFEANAGLKASMGGSATGANIAQLGVISQVVKKTEKTSATQAMQSSMSFIRDMSSQTEIKRLGGLQFADKKTGMLKDPQEIVKSILDKLGGNMSGLSKLMSNQNSRAVVNAFADPYMKAYRGTKGTTAQKEAAGHAAVDAAFAEVQKATMSNAALQDQLGATLKTTESQFTILKNKLSQSLGDTADKLAPKLLDLAPTAASAVNALGSLATWAASNPLQAAVTGLGASVLKTVGADMASNLASSMATSTGKAFAGSGLKGNVLGNLGAGLTIAATAVTIAEVGMLTIDKVMAQRKEGDDRVRKDDLTAMNAASHLAMAKAKLDRETAGTGGMITTEHAAEASAEYQQALAEAEASKKAVAGRLAGADDYKKGVFSSKDNLVTEGVNSMFGTSYFGSGKNLNSRSDDQASVAQYEALKAEMARLSAIMSGELRVTVTNQPGPGMPGVNETARTGVR